MKIVIDAKNLALYKGGISQWFGHQLQHWLDSSIGKYKFILVYPSGVGLNQIFMSGAIHKFVSWPYILPRKLRHIYYDNVQFPRELKKLKPKFIFSPYHDVRLPKKSPDVFSVITVHDLCFLDVPQAYPWFIRTYYLWMLRLNLSRANHVITISKATRNRLIEEFQLPVNMISIVPNSIDPEFFKKIPDHDEQQIWRANLGGTGAKFILYSSGIDHRKNVDRLTKAIRVLWAQGLNIILCITGSFDPRWKTLFTGDEISSGQIRFLGFLSLPDLRVAYQSVDLVVYPSLCEGFGRACIESMICGTPLACSDLPVFHEVAGDYASYFDPLDVVAISKSISSCLVGSRKEPLQDSLYEIGNVQAKFIRTMDRLMIKAKALLSSTR